MGALEGSGRAFYSAPEPGGDGVGLREKVAISIILIMMRKQAPRYITKQRQAAGTEQSREKSRMHIRKVQVESKTRSRAARIAERGAEQQNTAAIQSTCGKTPFPFYPQLAPG